MKQALSKLFTFLGKALSEDNGNPSQIRLTTGATYTFLIPAITFGFVWVVIHHPDLVILYLTSLLAFLGSLIGLKVMQKGKEDAPKS